MLNGKNVNVMLQYYIMEKRFWLFVSAGAFIGINVVHIFFFFFFFFFQLPTGFI